MQHEKWSEFKNSCSPWFYITFNTLGYCLVGSIDLLPLFSILSHVCRSLNGSVCYLQHLKRFPFCSLPSTTNCLPSQLVPITCSSTFQSRGGHFLVFFPCFPPSRTNYYLLVATCNLTLTGYQVVCLVTLYPRRNARIPSQKKHPTCTILTTLPSTLPNKIKNTTQKIQIHPSSIKITYKVPTHFSILLPF